MAEEKTETIEASRSLGADAPDVAEPIAVDYGEVVDDGDE